MGEREQKRLYYAPYLDFAGSAYPWLYYQLGLDNKQHAVYHGIQVSDDIVMGKDSNNQYANNPFDRSVFLYPTEYNSYGAGASLSIQYKLDINGNWRQDFMINDHLGSVRTVLRDISDTYPSYIVKAQYDYEPFGEILYHKGASRSRNTFIGKEKDWETMIDFYRGSLADHGVRKYEDFSGRFTSVDPLWEKYYGWSPYHYSLNNPLSLKDPLGTVVIAMDENSRTNITNSVESQYRDLIAFKDNGTAYLTENPKVAPMSKDNSTFSNIGALRYLINHKESIQVSESTIVKLFSNNEKGNGNPESIDIDAYKGNGITLLKKTSGEDITSTKDVHQVVISPNNFQTNLTGNNSKGNTTAHELYGHMFLYLWGPYTYKGHDGKTGNHIKKVEENQKK